MGMQFLSLMYTFNVSLEGVFDDNWCGDDQECLLGSLVGTNERIQIQS